MELYSRLEFGNDRSLVFLPNGIYAGWVAQSRIQIGEEWLPLDCYAPLLCDPKMQTFSDWSAFDDFEGMPLHGTFLVDRDGMIRWQDISYEPFDEPKWLLTECQRLLDIRR